MKAGYTRRRAGSVRFDPYYKVQVWDTAALAWIDVQQTYPTIDAAEADAPRGVRVRIMEINMAGRRPVPELVAPPGQGAPNRS